MSQLGAVWDFIAGESRRTPAGLLLALFVAAALVHFEAGM